MMITTCIFAVAVIVFLLYVTIRNAMIRKKLTDADNELAEVLVKMNGIDETAQPKTDGQIDNPNRYIYDIAAAYDNRAEAMDDLDYFHTNSLKMAALLAVICVCTIMSYCI